MGAIRKHHRFPVDFGSTFSGELFAGQGTIGNLSIGGCSIESKVTLTAKSNVSLEIRIPDSPSPLHITRAVVRWARGNSFGVEFDEISNDDRSLLHHLIERLEQGSQITMSKTGT